MRVRVKALRPFNAALGASELELDRPAGTTLEALVRALCEEHPAFAREALDKDGRVALTLNMMVSGRPVGEHDLARELQDGDTVLMFMPLSGG